VLLFAQTLEHLLRLGELHKLGGHLDLELLHTRLELPGMWKTRSVWPSDTTNLPIGPRPAEAGGRPELDLALAWRGVLEGA
jgi:hypothetical protein